MNNNKITASKSLEYKTKLKRSTPNNDNTLDVEVVAPLKHLSNLWRSLDLSLINCEIELHLSWTKELQYLKYLVIPRIPWNQDAIIAPVQEVQEIPTTAAIFQINNANLYAPVVTFSIDDNIKFLQNISKDLKII